ncbi:MAG: hypothetical protein KIT87_27945 [Anaerolineae bacterium]|nr:hypothetical protein [Anaerolineae bacterium]
MPSKEGMYTAYRAHALRQWIVDVEASETTPQLIYLRGHSPANGTRHGFMLRERTEVPSRVQALRGLKGIEQVDEGFYTSVVYCDPDRRDALVEAIQARLAEAGFLTTAEWEARSAVEVESNDPRPLKHIRLKPPSLR